MAGDFWYNIGMEMGLLQILNILHVVNDGFQASILLLLPFVVKEFHLNFAMVGFLGAAMNSLQIVLALPSGSLSIRYGGLRMLLWGGFISALGFMALAFGSSFYWLVPLFMIVGLGFGLFHPIAFALVTKLSKKESRGNAMGTFTAVGDIGRIGLSALITFIVVKIGWRSTAVSYGIMGIFVMLYCWKRLSSFKMSKQDLEAKPSHLRWSMIVTILSNKQFIFANVSGMFDSFASSSLFIFLPFIFLAKGIDLAVLGLVTSTFFVGNIAGKYVLGKLVDRFGNVKIFVTAELCMAVSIILFTYSVNYVFLILSSVILGALTKGTVPVLQTMVAESIEDKPYFDHAYGVSALLMGGAATAAPLVLGLISDVYGIYVAFYTSALFALLAIIPSLKYSKNIKL